MLQTRILIKKDDKVKVVAGKDKGKIGKVLKVDRKKDRLLVEKINLIKHHTRPSAKNKQGGIVEGEAPIIQRNDYVQQVCKSNSNKDATSGRRKKDKALREMRRSN